MDAGILLCICFFFSSFGDRMWNFAVGVFFIELTPGSLALSAVYALVVTGMVVVFTPNIGRWVDRTDRMKAMRLMLFAQYILIVLSAVCILLLLYNVTDNPHTTKLLKVLAIACGALANLATQGEKVALSKDWVVVICGTDEDYLSVLNSRLRTIDLVLAVIAPISVGAIISLISPIAGAFLICGWNIFSMFAEYFQLVHIYETLPALATQRVPMDTGEYETIYPSKPPVHLCMLAMLKQSISGWHVYMQQSVALAGVSLSMLYLTVLGFSAVTTGYATTQGLESVYVSLFFGLASLFGVLGAMIFPLMRTKFGPVRSGKIGLIMQLLALMLCVAGIWAPGSPSNLVPNNELSPVNATAHPVAASASTTKRPLTSVLMILFGIVLSRSGLWIADLSITQLQQTNVAENDRSTVGGAQTSLNSALELLVNLLTIALPHMEEFGILILVSVIAVFFALCIYLRFASKFIATTDEKDKRPIISNGNAVVT